MFWTSDGHGEGQTEAEAAGSLADCGGDRQAGVATFYAKVNEVLSEHGFDRKVEHLCQRFYKPVKRRPILAPGVCFQLLLVGCFEEIDIC